MTRTAAIAKIYAGLVGRMAQGASLTDVNPETGMTRDAHFRAAAERGATAEIERARLEKLSTRRLSSTYRSR